MSSTRRQAARRVVSTSTCMDVCMIRHVGMYLHSLVHNNRKDSVLTDGGFT
jgi:hypothetical protein